MKYCSIDIETTGLDPEICDILEIGIAIEDTSNILPLEELPKFHTYVKKDSYKGEPYGFSMHPTILRRIAEKTEGFTYLYPGQVCKAIYDFLYANGFQESPAKFNVAGKNFGTFDLQFLKKLPKFNELLAPRQRIIDPGILFLDITKDDKIPGLEECMKRCGIDKTVEHTALEDALDVIQIIRKYYGLPL